MNAFHPTSALTVLTLTRQCLCCHGNLAGRGDRVEEAGRPRKDVPGEDGAGARRRQGYLGRRLHRGGMVWASPQGERIGSREFPNVARKAAPPPPPPFLPPATTLHELLGRFTTGQTERYLRCEDFHDD